MIGKNTYSFDVLLQRATGKRTLIFSLLIVGALLAFEMFNYSTTDFALTDLLGDLRFAGMRWSTILALAFCGIDFAGIARLFTPEQGADEPLEVWYLLGAWLLAATMNALLTWWGVSIALLSHQSLGNAVISAEMLLKGVPVFVALMVWLSRVLIIGTFSVAGERLFMQPQTQPVGRKTTSKKSSPRQSYRPQQSYQPRQSYQPQRASGRYGSTQTRYAAPASSSTSFRPAPKPRYEDETTSASYDHPDQRKMF